MEFLCNPFTIGYDRAQARMIAAFHCDVMKVWRGPTGCSIFTCTQSATAMTAAQFDQPTWKWFRQRMCGHNVSFSITFAYNKFLSNCLRSPLRPKSSASWYTNRKHTLTFVDYCTFRRGYSFVHLFDGWPPPVTQFIMTCSMGVSEEIVNEYSSGSGLTAL